MNKYESYKDSGIEWIGEIPKHWEIRKYKHDIVIQNGYPFKSELFDLTNGFPIIRIRDVTSGTINTFYNEEPLIEYIVKNGDLLVGMDGDFNTRWWEGQDALLNQRVCRVFEKKSMHRRYISYILPIQLKIINEITYFTTVKHLSSFDLLENKTLIPPLNEQKIISRYLDKKTSRIDSLINKIERKIELLKEKRTALINHYVTKGMNPNVEMKDSGIEWIGEIPKHWEITKLKRLIDSIKDGTHGSHESVEDGYIFLSGKNVQDGYLKITNHERMISKKAHTLITQNGYPSRGDVLVSSVGSIGRSCVFEFDEPISFQRSVCFIRPSKKINSYFLSYKIQSNSCQTQIITLINQSTIGGVYMDDMTNLLITIPPLTEQKLIASYLDKQTSKIDSLITKLSLQTDLLKEYRQALISSAVTGKIRITKDML